jgi:hypothetical protein
MTLTMRPEIRDLWADALESGEYTQTGGVLHRVGGGFCCLGVLSHLASEAGVIGDPIQVDDGTGEQVFEYGGEEDHSYTGLPRAVIEWAGFAYDDPDENDGFDDTISDPRLTNAKGYSEHAAGWNDNMEATFADIAAMVRAIPASVPAVV